MRFTQTSCEIYTSKCEIYTSKVGTSASTKKLHDTRLSRLIIPAWVVSSTTVSCYSRHWGCSDAAAVPARGKTSPPRLARHRCPWPGKTWTTGVDAEAMHPLTSMQSSTTTTKMAAATATTTTADTIWRSRLRSPPDVPRLEGIGERYTPNHLKHPPPRFSEETKQTTR
jgi:hypothetical protein